MWTEKKERRPETGRGTDAFSTLPLGTAKETLTLTNRLKVGSTVRDVKVIRRAGRIV
jgi:hypothetical protein